MIPRERASVVVIHEDRLLAVALEDPATKVIRLFLPGGALEAGETPADAAIRETLEETGFRVKVEEQGKRARRYPFRWNDADYDCLTHFFPARLVDPDGIAASVEDASYHRGVFWVPLLDVPKTFDYDRYIYPEIAALLVHTPRTHPAK